MFSVTDIRRHYRFEDAGLVRAVLHDGEQCRWELCCFEAGQALEPPLVGQATAACYVVEGTGLFSLDGKGEHVSAGGAVCAWAGTTLELSNPGPGRLVVALVTAPPTDA